MIYNQINDNNISFMGMGIMFHDDNQNNTKKIISQALESGVNYFEACEFYNKGQCQERLAEALQIVPRESYYLCDKLPIALLPKYTGSLEETFHFQLQKMKTNYFDYYLLQALSRYSYNYLEQYNVLDFLQKKKEQGYIKHLGFSFHDNAKQLKKILNLYNDWELIQLQINYYDWYLGEAKELYNIAKETNIPISVMSPTKGGLLINSLPPSSIQRMNQNNISSALLCYDFLTTLEGVKLILTGPTKLEYLNQNCEYFSNRDNFGLTTEKHQHLLQNIKDYQAANYIGCTNCKYCLSHCSKNIPINEIFLNYNKFLATKDLNAREYIYNQIWPSKTKASTCIDCGSCYKACPQHLNIAKLFVERIFPLKR